MADIREFLKPNKIKIILVLSMAIPIIILIITVFGLNFTYTDYNYLASHYLVNPALFLITISLFLLFGLILSYLLGSLIDYYLKNKNLKIFIAFISGLISLLIIYILYKMVTEPIICDPVHEPHTGGIYHTKMLKDIQVDGFSVQNSFERCIENLGVLSFK